MKISELIPLLQQALEDHGDLRVIGSWEGTIRDPNSVYVTQELCPAEPIKALIIDVDYNSCDKANGDILMFEDKDPLW